MKSDQFVELFKKDCKYYDQNQNELKAILSLVNFKKAEKLVDIGAGVGRLTIPLSKYVNVVALDKDKSLLREIKDDKTKTANDKIENFYPVERFDYGLIVWPGFFNHREILQHIKKDVLKENGKLIVIKSKEHDLREIAKKLFPEIFDKSEKLLNIIPYFFKIEDKKIIETEFVYPNFDEALNLILFELESFYDIKTNDKQIKIIKDFIRKREKYGKVYMKAKLNVLLCK